jgi:hypothetical protein
MPPLCLNAAHISSEILHGEHHGEHASRIGFYHCTRYIFFIISVFYSLLTP